MEVWYHAKYKLMGIVAPRPKYGHIYRYNAPPWRVYATVFRYEKVYPIWTVPEDYGWTYLGPL